MFKKTIKKSIIFLGRVLPDKTYIKTVFFLRNRQWLNLDNPQTYNEKVNWLKLHDRKPIYTQMVDKKTAREIVARTIGTQYTTRLLGCWDRFEDIDFSTLPNSFILKCNHDSGSVVVCKDKTHFDYKRARKILTKHLKNNAFYYAREWPYKNIKPQILAEEFLSDGTHPVLPVYKIFCFHGEPKIIQAIHNDKQPNETVDYLDTQWNWLDCHQYFPRSRQRPTAPVCLEQMLDMARRLSNGLTHVRVDFYEINGKPCFSEFTFYNDAGIARFTPDKWDHILGQYITLPSH